MLLTLGTRHGRAFGYATPCSAPHSLNRQHSVLTTSGVPLERIFSEHAQATGRRPALTALTEHVRAGDSVAVVGVHRLGHTGLEIADRLIDFRERGIALRVLQFTVEAPPEIDVTTPGQPFGRSRPIGRPRALDAAKTAFARQLIAGGLTKTEVAEALGVSRPTLYKALNRH